MSTLCCCKCTDSETNLTKNTKQKKSKKTNEYSRDGGLAFTGISCLNNEIIIDKSTKFCIRASSTQENIYSPKLYPPGRILHIVRKYPKNSFDLNDSLNETKISQKSKHCYFFKENEKDLQQKIKNNLPVYQVIETENENFNELLISPRMLQDHMPDNLIKCMKAVLKEPAPKKPPRQFDTK